MTKDKTDSIFFATRPIAPPWDEASKNMVREIAKHLDHYWITLLTFQGEEELLNRPSVEYKKIYPLGLNNSRNSASLTFRQRSSFFFSIIFSKASIYHFYFSSEIYSTKVIRIIKKFKRGRYLQTIATPIKTKSTIPDIVFGDAVVVQSDYSLKMFNSMGIKNVSRIYPAIDTEYFKPGIDSTQLRKQLDIPNDNKVVLYCGNFYLGCNDVLIETILTLSKKMKQVTFVLACRIGFPEDLLERDRMKSIFQKEGVLKRVLFLQSVENMKQLIALSDVHIFPGRKIVYKADIPLVLLESLSMEKPIVITDISPLNEIMKEDIGNLIPVGNVGLLVDSLINLLNDDKVRQKKGENGRRMVKREFCLGNYIAQYSALYDNLLGNGKIQSTSAKQEANATTYMAT